MHGLADGEDPEDKDIGYRFEFTAYAMKFMRACLGPQPPKALATPA